MAEGVAKGRNKYWTARYAFINITYYAGFCTVHAYAAVYLLAHGFTNTEVGILFSMANIVSAIIQPYIAGMIDKPGPLTNRNYSLVSVGLIFACCLSLMLLPENKTAIFIIYAILYMVQFAYQPIVTALCFEYQKAGCDIFYGLARGLGSAGFAVTSAFIGGMVERNSVSVLLVANIIIMLLSAVALYTFKKPEKSNSYDSDFDGLRENSVDHCPHPKTTVVDVNSASLGSEKLVTAVDNTDTVTDLTDSLTSYRNNDNVSDNGIFNDDAIDNVRIDGNKAHNNIMDFARTYPAFMLFLVATMCFYFAHNMINDFMIQIIRNLGGAETELGYATFLAAMLELPIMAVISVVMRKIKPYKLLILSGAAFFVKTFILVFASGISAMYVSQAFQMLAYAVFVPAAAYYVSQTMEELDQVKGQAYVSSATTVGGVFSSLICGRILDSFGILPMLVTGSTVCAIGVLIAAFALLRLPHHKEI